MMMKIGGKPITIRKRVLVNHYGTIVTSEPITQLEYQNFNEITIDEGLYVFIVSHC